MKNLHALLEGVRESDNSESIMTDSELIIESSNLEVELLQEGVIGNVVEAIRKLFKRFMDFFRKLLKNVRDNHKREFKKFEKLVTQFREYVANSENPNKKVEIDGYFNFKGSSTRISEVLRLTEIVIVKEDFSDLLEEGLGYTPSEYRNEMFKKIDVGFEEENLFVNYKSEDFYKIFNLEKTKRLTDHKMVKACLLITTEAFKELNEMDEIFKPLEKTKKETLNKLKRDKDKKGTDELNFAQGYILFLTQFINVYKDVRWIMIREVIRTTKVFMQ